MLIAVAAKVVAAAGGMAVAFEKGMREVNTLLRLPEDQFQSLQEQVLDFSTEIGVASQQTVPALYQAISAGVPQQNVFDFMATASQAAIGGVTDLKTSVDVLTTSVNNFSAQGLTAVEAADALFTTVRLGKTTFDELAAGIPQVLPIASAAGVTFDEVAAALAVLTAKTGQTSESATRLRSAIENMVAPSIRTKRRLEELGLADLDVTVKTKGLQAAMERLRDATNGNLETLRKLLGSTEAVQGVLLLTGDNAESFNVALDEMADKGGAAKTAFDEMEKSVARLAERVKAKLSAAFIKFGLKVLPAVEKVLNAALFVLDKIPAPVLAGALALGVFLVALTGVMLILPAATVAVGALATAFGVLAAVSLPVVLVAGVAALAALGVGLVVTKTLAEDFAAAERELFARVDTDKLTAQRDALMEQAKASQAAGLRTDELRKKIAALDEELANAVKTNMEGRDEFFLLRDALLRDAEAFEAAGQDASALREEAARLTEQFREARNMIDRTTQNLDELEEAAGGARGAIDQLSDAQERAAAAAEAARQTFLDEQDALQKLGFQALLTQTNLKGLVSATEEEAAGRGAIGGDFNRIVAQVREVLKEEKEFADLIEAILSAADPSGALRGEDAVGRSLQDIAKNTAATAENTRQGPSGLLEILLARRLTTSTDQELNLQGAAPADRFLSGRSGPLDTVGKVPLGGGGGNVIIEEQNIEIGAGARTTAGEVTQGMTDAFLRGRLADQVGE